MTYQDFRSDCFLEADIIHKENWLKYEIDKYTNWDYDQASGILTFSNENEELNFRYYQVGTFSKNTNTWKWSWDNEHTHKKVKEKLSQIRDFGYQNSYDKLTIGTFETHEDEGWEFASIACKLLEGIGMYRPVSDHLLIFMVLYECIDNQAAENEKEKYVYCEQHERKRRAFICQHLTKTSKIGFEESFETFEDMEFEYKNDDFQAWCNECEKVRLELNGWNEESENFAKIRLICETCYFEIKESNK
jgi:hypothetical protein